MAERVVEVRSGDLTFPVRVDGPDDGETVILLHGFPETSAAWSPCLGRLAAAGFRALAPDQRGYAATARPRGVGHYHLARLVDDVLRVADELGARRFHLVGHDWGGMVAWALAAWHPERLHSLTSVSTPHPRAMASSLVRSTQLGRSWYIGFFQLPQVPERVLTAANGALLRRVLRSSGLPGAHADAYTDAMLQPGALTAAISWYRALRPRSSLGVGRITVPTLYVWSTGDVALGRVAAEATGDHVDPPYRFEVLKGASHWIPETRPDELTALLLDQLAAHPGVASA